MHYLYPADFIFWAPVTNHKNIKQELLPIIKENLINTEKAQLNKWLCDVNTEFFSKDNKYIKYINLIVDEIYPALDKLFTEINLKIPKTSKVTSIWYNHYSNSQGQEVHSHIGNGSTISGIYLLNLEEENKTVFYSSAADYSLCNPVKATENINEGNIILFPSHLLHYALPCEKERVTIAFNIECKY
jgi:hypothetical protein